MRYFRVLYWMVMLVAMVVGVGSARAQDDPNFESGFRAFASYHGGNIDQINLFNGGLLVDIPLISYPQKGKLKLSYTLHYQNQGDYSNEIWGQTQGGTRYHYWKDWDNTGRLKHSFAVNQDGYPTGKGSETRLDTNTYLLSDQVIVNGSGHTIAPTSHDGSAWETVDATGIRGNISGGLLTFVDSDGISYGNTIQDPNGNQIALSSTTGITTDSLGRSIPSPVATTDYSKCTGPMTITSAKLWNLPGVNGGTYPILFCYTSASETDGIGGQGWNQSWPSATHYNTDLLQSVVLLNDSEAWTFQYTADGVNDLATITFPTGATISYTWTRNTVCADSTIIFNRAVTSRTMNANDGTPASQWNYKHGATTTVTDPALNDTVHTFTALLVPDAGGNMVYSCSFYENQTQYYQGSSTGGTLLKTVNTTYTSNEPTKWPGYTALNVFPTSATTIWPNNQQSQVQNVPDNAVTFYSPIFLFTGGLAGTAQPFTGMYGDTIATREYDYGNGAPGPLLRTTTTSYLALSNSSYLANNLLKLPSNVRVTGAGPGSYTTYGYDEPNGSPSGARGNQTSVNRWLNTTGAYLTTSFVYSSAGLVTFSKDPKLNPTTYGYGACYAGSGPTSITNAQNQTTNYCYDFNTGLTTSVTNPNGQPTSYAYDNMLRLSQITYPPQTVNGVQLNGATTFSYPTTTQVQFSELMDNTGRYRVSNLQVDGVGREIRRNTANGESIPYDQIDTCYDSLGRVSYKSYPYQSTGLSAARVCSGAGDSFTFDGLSRTKSVTHSDGSSLQTTYTGRATSVTDEGNGTQGVQRISQVDGLGRLTSLCEVSGSLTVGISGSQSASSCGLDISGTGFLTTHAYDALNDLTSVAQSPLNPRAFVYDSLSRLTQATSPESGTTCYGTLSGGVCQQNGYDANGNLVTKTDARGITTTYSYDSLNELTGKTYTDGTPSVTFTYGQSSALGVSLTNTVGRRSSMSTAATSSNVPTGSVFSYDSMGRVLNNSQCTPQNCSGALFPVNYAYDLIGDLTTSTNGLGLTLTYSVNAAGRLTTLASSATVFGSAGTLLGSPNLVHYNAAGSLLSASLGNGVSETRNYDGRLRLCSITDGSIYSLAIPSNTPNQCPQGSANGYAPNGDILLANDSVNGNWTYGYDAFNRLVSASKPGQSFAYGYDRFGNRWTVNGNGPGFDANNRIVPGINVTYDAAGNTTDDGSLAYTYDAEGRIATAGGSYTYTYDGDGKRVRKAASASTVDFLYDTAGHEIAQVSSIGTWTRGEIYAAGRHWATLNNSNIYYNEADWLGTERARSVLGATTYCETITSLPFGDGQTTSGSCGDPSPMHFTGKERDSESNLDNFGARYDSSQYGRFMTPDPGNASGLSHMDDSQSWNGYAYARNNPLSYTDPSGLNYTVCQYDGDGNKTNCADLTKDQYKQYQQQNSNVHSTASGDLYLTNENGSETKIGNASYYNEKDVAAAKQITQYGPPLEFLGELEGVAIMGPGMVMLEGTLPEAGLAGGLGLGAAARGEGQVTPAAESTGRTVPANLKEQLAMQQAKSNPAAGEPVPLKMNDPRWPDSQGWVKMRQNVNGVEVHYNLNTKTGEVADFKFK
jgi:RHS repeat-associated protein